MKFEIAVENRLINPEDIPELLREAAVQAVAVVERDKETAYLTGPVYDEDGQKVGNWRFYA